MLMAECIAVLSVFIAAKTVRSISNTFVLSNETFPYDKSLVNH